MRPGGAGVRSTLSMRPPMDHCGPVGRSFEPFPGSALDGSIVDRFDAIVQRFSERVALSDCTDRLTHGELARLVYRTAAAVSDCAADRSSPVAIVLSADILFPAAMLGTPASGRGFVPINAGDPPERIRHAAAQSGAAAVISAGELAGQSRYYGRSTTCSVPFAARSSESIAALRFDEATVSCRWEEPSRNEGY